MFADPFFIPLTLVIFTFILVVSLDLVDILHESRCESILDEKSRHKVAKSLQKLKEATKVTQ